MVTQKFFGRLRPLGFSCLFVVGVVLFNLDFFSCLCFICFFYVPLFMGSPRIHGSLVPLKFGMILLWY